MNVRGADPAKASPDGVMVESKTTPAHVTTCKRCEVMRV